MKRRIARLRPSKVDKTNLKTFVTVAGRVEHNILQRDVKMCITYAVHTAECQGKLSGKSTGDVSFETAPLRHEVLK
eukprot:671994-Amorphochlora_amoeboformis.AAC.1